MQHGPANAQAAAAWKAGKIYVLAALASDNADCESEIDHAETRAAVSAFVPGVLK